MKVKRVTQRQKEIAYRQGRVMELRLICKPVEEIARELDVSQPTVYKDLLRLMELTRDARMRGRLEEVKAGMLKPKGSSWTYQKSVADRQGRVMELRLMGEPKKRIAEELVISPSTVARDLERLIELARGRLGELLDVDMRFKED